MRAPPAWAKPWAQGANPFALTELEVATGHVLGQVDAPWPEGPGTEGGPLDVLFDEARRILGGGRCAVAFSGGRDSSALLACFLHVARRDGFEEPTAITARWPGNAAAEESEWQDHVARGLKVKRWEIITPGTDFDLLGPLATGLLRAFGLLWPAPAAVFLPMIDTVGDGTLVTGDGGDEVFGLWGLGRIWSKVKQGRGLRSAVRPVLGGALPDRLRRLRALSGAEAYQSWLTPEAWTAQREVLAAEAVAVAPLWWPDYLHAVNSDRGLRVAERAYATICASRGGSLATPLKSPPFLFGAGSFRGPVRPRGPHVSDACVVLTAAGRHRPEPGLQGYFRQRALGTGQPPVRQGLGRHGCPGTVGRRRCVEGSLVRANSRLRGGAAVTCRVACHSYRRRPGHP